MRSNKIFFDLYSTSGGTLPYEEYRQWYDRNDTVYIALIDLAIYTKVPRKEMFEKNMHHGCFIEHKSYDTPEEVRSHALDLAERRNLLFVEPDEFIRLEKMNESERVAKAFAIAEQMIANN